MHDSRCNNEAQISRSTYILYTEFPYGVVHKDSEVFHCHPHISIHPAALIWPVLVTLVLGEMVTAMIQQIPVQEYLPRNVFKLLPFLRQYGGGTVE